jgi:hypothetical protein
MSLSMTNSSNNNENKSNTNEMQDFESNSIALYNQQIIQILCSDTLELEIELARDLVSLISSLIFHKQNLFLSVNHHLNYHHRYHHYNMIQDLILFGFVVKKQKN